MKEVPTFILVRVIPLGESSYVPNPNPRWMEGFDLDPYARNAKPSSNTTISDTHSKKVDTPAFHCCSRNQMTESSTRTTLGLLWISAAFSSGFIVIFNHLKYTDLLPESDSTSLVIFFEQCWWSLALWFVVIWAQSAPEPEPGFIIDLILQLRMCIIIDFWYWTDVSSLSCKYEAIQDASTRHRNLGHNAWSECDWSAHDVKLPTIIWHPRQ